MSVDGLAAFVAGLPAGKRHAGTFWALNAAREDGLNEQDIKPILDAARRIGLEEGYLVRTLREIQGDG